MPPITILIVEKTGSIKELSLKTYDEAELYKKVGFKSNDGFKCYTQWNIEELNGKSYSISVYGKTTGRANQENKFEFPPPIDNTLFFGNCLIINTPDNEITNLSKKEWNSIYEHLYGGFEDIGEDDSEDEEDEDDDLPRTKSGYVKDDFVVDDDEEPEEDDEEEEEEEIEEEDDEEEVFTSKSKTKSKSVKAKAVKVKAVKEVKSTSKKAKITNPTSVFNTILTNEDDNYLDCTSELSEESYV